MNSMSRSGLLSIPTAVGSAVSFSQLSHNLARAGKDLEGTLGLRRPWVSLKMDESDRDATTTALRTTWDAARVANPP